jgi:hypothetical protein
MKIKKYLTFAVLGFLLVGCYPDGPESYEELDVVYTNYTETFDFDSKGTYAMPDSIVKVTGNLAEGEKPEYVKEPYNTQILQKIEENMSELGWTRVNIPENADLVLFPAIWTNTTIVYWYDYWCWYYYYYCGWGYPMATSYTTGTFVMTLVSNDAEFIEPSSVWTAAVNGLLSGSYDILRVTKAIDQAFEQSPYLDTK